MDGDELHGTTKLRRSAICDVGSRNVAVSDTLRGENDYKVVDQVDNS